MSQSNRELRTYHGGFSNAGNRLVARCENCSWGFDSKSQSSATSAAKRHVDQNPSHVVLTQRTQVKRTWAREVTVLR